MNLVKKSLLLVAMFSFLVIPTIASSVNSQELQWYQTSEWYENELGAQKNEANPAHLAVTLIECFSHNPEDAVAFDKAVQFWLCRGGDINQKFNTKDLSLLCPGITSKDESVTLLELFVGSGSTVSALLTNGASTIVDDKSILDIWVKQFVAMTQYDDNDQINGCHDCVNMLYSWQYKSLQLLFAASDKSDQNRFLAMHPEYQNIITKSC